MSTTVLYVEDDATNILLVERLLRRRPQASLLVARNGADGVTAAASDQPALILLDNQLPDASGGDVLRRLAADPATARIPVIMVTGDSSRATASELLSLGAVDVLIKPFDIHQFMAAIDRYVAGEE